MTFFEFFLTAARAGIVPAYVFKSVARRFLVAMITVGPVHVAVVMAVSRAVVMIAVRAVNVFLLGHVSYSGM